MNSIRPSCILTLMFSNINYVSITNPHSIIINDTFLLSEDFCFSSNFFVIGSIILFLEDKIIYIQSTTINR